MDVLFWQFVALVCGALMVTFAAMLSVAVAYASVCKESLMAITRRLDDERARNEEAMYRLERRLRVALDRTAREQESALISRPLRMQLLAHGCRKWWTGNGADA